jgi:hypothetical protein
LNPTQFRFANLFRLLLHGHNRRSHIHGALLLLESVYFAGNQGFGIAGDAPALFHVRCGDRLQVVNVVDKDAFELSHCGIYIARDRNVDEEHGFVAAAVHECLAMFAAEDGMRGTGGADDNVGFADCVVELIERNYAAVELLGHEAGTL